MPIRATLPFERAHWLWGRIAAKEAARRLWLATGDPPRFPADLAIIGGVGSPPRLHDLARPERNDLPTISIAHTEGIVVALAARDPHTPVGIDIEPILAGNVATDNHPIIEEELLELPHGAEKPPGEWDARLKAARQAAAKASGLSPAADSAVTQVVGTNSDTGDVFVVLPADSGSVPRIPAGLTIWVRTAKRGNHIWAWTLGEKVQP